MRYLFNIRIYFITLFILISINNSAQYYSSGSDPARLSWQQIKTPVVKLIFDKSIQKEAEKLAAFIDSMAPYIGASLNSSQKRIPLLLHNYSAYPNGFVSWAPGRSEFFTIPSQDIQSTDWLKHLVIHEYRHVIQINKLNQGFTKWTSYLFGQQATGAMLGIFIPMWLVEGDAVITETTLTKSGRGRSFTFNNELKAQLLTKGAYSYDKAYLGSYKDYVPSYYHMGYLLSAKARQQYGPQLWEKTLEYVGKNSWNPGAFNTGIKRVTGIKQNELYKQTFQQVTKEWQEEMQKQTTTHAIKIAVPENDYLNYRFPIAINDSTIIAELNGPGIRSQIISINIVTGNITPLSYTGTRENEPLGANQNMVVWTEIQNHPRWEHESWSVIRTYNLKSKKNKTITRKSYYFAPSLHPQKNIIAAIEATPEYKFYIVLLNAENGNCLQRIATPNNNYALTPSWNIDGEDLVVVLLSDKGKALFNFNPKNNKWSRLTPWGYNEYEYPIQKGQKIWYSAQANYNNEIFVIDTLKKTTHQISSTAFGATHPTITPNSNKLIYSTYNHKGYRPIVHNDSNIVKADNKSSSVIHKLVNDLSNQEPQITNTTAKNKQYSSKKYSKWNLINIHSWAPVFIDFSDNNIYTGISLMSQNILNSTIVSAGYNADPAYKNEKYNLNFSYKGLFPVFDIKYSFGTTSYESEGYFNGQEDNIVYRVNTNQDIKHHYLKTGISFPLNFSRRNYYRYIEAVARLTWQHRTGITYPLTQYRVINDKLMPTGNNIEEVIPDINFYGMEYHLSLQNIRRGTSRDVGSRFGQYATLFFRHTPWGNYNNGNILGFLSRFYLPGLARYHSLTISNDYQSKNLGQEVTTEQGEIQHYSFSDIVSYPRGYTYVENEQMYLFRATYMMPLWNPDFSVGKFAYIKRIRMNLFFDSAYAMYKSMTFNYQINNKSRPKSYGIELHADTHFLRFIIPFSIGTRMGYRTGDKKIFSEFILQSSLSGFLVN